MVKPCRQDLGLGGPEALEPLDQVMGQWLSLPLAHQHLQPGAVNLGHEPFVATAPAGPGCRPATRAAAGANSSLLCSKWVWNIG